MGMTTDEAINRVQPYAHPYCVCLQITGEEAHQVSNAIMVLANTSQKYQMMQADYEARLKADMVAMLEELKLEFEEYEPKWAENEDQVIASNRTWEDFDDIIQQKIDALRGKV
jgi:hypothetical protein